MKKLLPVALVVFALTAFAGGLSNSASPQASTRPPQTVNASADDEADVLRADSDAVTKCQRGCNSQCDGAKNKSKCVNECRRACR